jgi:diguanylate cyclase
MIERCDRGLYQAKRSGRNRTVAKNDIEGETAAA